jgi:WhiB family redox-sensing transcriptional regulator
MELMHSDMPNWVEYGEPICRQVDPDLFFPIKGDDQIQIRMAKDICKSCTLKKVCLEYALTDWRIDGIWGGTTLRERQIIRRQRRIA